MVVVALVVASVAADALLGSSAAAITPSTSQAISQSVFRPLTPATADGPTPTASPSSLATSSDGDWTLVPVLVAVPDPTATPAPADVVRFRPRAGQTGVVPPDQVSVRFVAAMDRASTQAAFAVTVNGTRVTGRFGWAEGNTVLVFTPSTPFPYGATVRLSVSGATLSWNGTALLASHVATFTVMAKPAPAVRPAPARVRVVSPAPSSSAWRWPLVGPITQYFGQSLTIYGFHYGIDIDGQTGDPVRAARAGVVIAAGHVASDPCGGLEVRIDHGDGFVTWYHHFSQVDVHVGERVDAGTLIGRVGATGCAFGSHLHFAILLNGVFVDPLRYLPRR